MIPTAKLRFLHTPPPPPPEFEPDGTPKKCAEKNLQGGKTFEERWNFKSKSGCDFWIQLIYQGFGTPMFHWCSWCKSGGKISHWSRSLKCLFCNIESPELVNSWKPPSVLATLDEEVPFDATSVGPWLCMVLSGRADLISSTSNGWDASPNDFCGEKTQKYIQNGWVFVVISSSTNKKGLRFVDQILYVVPEFHEWRRTGNTGRCSQLACLGCSADPVTGGMCLAEMIEIDLVMLHEKVYIVWNRSSADFTKFEVGLIL